MNNIEFTLTECAAILAALDAIDNQYKALKQMGNVPSEIKALARMMGAPDNFLDDIRQGLLEEGQAYMKAITTAKAKVTLISAALEEAEEKAGKARLIAEAEEAISGA